MPAEVRKVCRLAGITNKSVLLQIVRQGDTQKMLALVEKIATQGGATREQVRKETQKPKAGRPKPYTFNFRPDEQVVQPSSELREEERLEGRDHRDAREHPRGAAEADLSGIWRSGDW